MENANSLGNMLAYGAIILFVLLLLFLFVRTALMVGSVFVLAWSRRKDADEAPQEQQHD